MINIWNPKFSWTINEEGDDSELDKTLCSTSGLIVRYSTSLDRGDRIEVWEMGNAPTLLRSRVFEAHRHLHIRKVDERFIVADRNFIDLTSKNAETLFFISTETLEVVTSLSAMNYECHLPNKFKGLDVNFKCVYDHGLLFQYRGNGIVRILDVASGTYVSNVRIPFQSEDKKLIELLDTWASTNSNVIVIGWKCWKNCYFGVPHLSVYDLEAVKKANSDPSPHLLYTLDFVFDIHSFVMNESEIAFSGEDYTDWCVTVLKFVNFNLAQRKSFVEEDPEYNEDNEREVGGFG
jgi:hypothetical protein